MKFPPDFYLCRRGLSVWLLAGLLLAVGSDGVYAGLSSTNFHTGLVVGNPPPVIDATNFINSATWGITTAPHPYNTSDTLNYDNSGTMVSALGWDFALFPSQVGVRAMSATFTNGNNGIITANDFLSGNLNYGSFLLVSATNLVNKGQLNASASGKILLSGVNVTLARSPIQIQPLSSTGGTYGNSHTNFAGDAGVYDQAWGLGTNQFFPHINFFISSDFTNPVVYSNVLNHKLYTNYVGQITTRAPEIVNGLTIPCGGRMGLFNDTANLPSSIPYLANNYLYVSDTNTLAVSNVIVAGGNISITGYASWTNSYQTTNIGVPVVVGTNTMTNFFNVPRSLIVQAVYVRVPDPNISAQIHFSPSAIPTNHAFTASVLLQTASTNLATLQSSLASLCLVDTMLSSTNNGLAANSNANLVAGCSGTTFRPQNYTLSRQVLADFTSGAPGFGTPNQNVVWQADFFTNIFAGLNPAPPAFPPGPMTNGYGVEPLLANYTAYSAYIDNLASEPPAGASPSLTNFPGEVRIYATNLDLYLTRIRAEGELLIQANNLTPNSTNSTMDCQNLSYTLGATNGFLHFQNLAHTTSSRLNGTINVCSVTWTNVINEIFNVGSTNVVTNAIPTTLYVMVLDASQLSSIVPVRVYDLLLTATNIEISDQMVIQQNLLLNGSAFTLDSSGSMSSGTVLQDWTSANMPGMQYFTNNGFISMANNAFFGNDAPSPLKAFVNRGSIFSSGQGIAADYVELDGINNAGTSGEFDVYGGNVFLSSAIVSAGVQVRFNAASLLVSNSIIAAGDLLSFTVTNNFSDGGTINTFSCANGFTLWIKPAAGNLLGTTLNSVIPNAAEEVDHVWAAINQGPTTAGYTDNAAVSNLVLTALNPGSHQLFYFEGPDQVGSYALYVNTLDVSSLGTGATNGNNLQVADNFYIYYTNAIGSAALTNNLPGGTADNLLNNALNGHLIWAIGASLPSATVPAPKLSGVVAPANGKFHFSVLSGANQTNVIQASTNFINWIPLYTNVGPFIFTNTLVPGYPFRYYRDLILGP